MCMLPRQFPPNPLLQSAHGTDDTSTTAHPTANLERDQKLSANSKGLPDLSGCLLLAENGENLGV